MKAAGGEEADESDPTRNDCPEWCISNIERETKNQNTDLCSTEEQCSGCDYCSSDAMKARDKAAKQAAKDAEAKAKEAAAAEAAQEKASAAAAKAEQQAAAKEAKAAECTVCGEGNNCCGAHGSWDGACPSQHSFEDGHVACLEVMKAAGGEEADSQTGEDTSDCTDWCSEMIENEKKNKNTDLCSTEDWCSGCEYCSTASKEATAARVANEAEALQAAKERSESG